jgi:dihydrofolate reductase
VNIVTQYLQAGLLDELQLHVVPILLGNGVRLFQDLGAAGIELRKTRSIDTPRATHLRFSVLS